MWLCWLLIALLEVLGLLPDNLLYSLRLLLLLLLIQSLFMLRLRRLCFVVGSSCAAWRLTISLRFLVPKTEQRLTVFLAGWVHFFRVQHLITLVEVLTLTAILVLLFLVKLEVLVELRGLFRLLWNVWVWGAVLLAPSSRFEEEVHDQVPAILVERNLPFFLFN